MQFSRASADDIAAAGIRILRGRDMSSLMKSSALTRPVYSGYGAHRHNSDWPVPRGRYRISLPRSRPQHYAGQDAPITRY